jgi:hypothetical protein
MCWRQDRLKKFGNVTCVIHLIARAAVDFWADSKLLLGSLDAR